MTQRQLTAMANVYARRANRALEQGDLANCDRYTQMELNARARMGQFEALAVDCGNCGKGFTHPAHLEEISCPSCGFTSEPCDFPDTMKKL